MNEDVATLVDVYGQGDKSVLPTLLHFPYLTEFFGDAVLSDPEGFLTAASQLPKDNQQAVAAGMAGPDLGIPRARFDLISARLNAVPSTSPNYSLAQMLLGAIEFENFVYMVNYFPPVTFTGPSAQLRLHWYSREFHALGQKPLYPPANANIRLYRLTILPAFTGPISATLVVSPDGTGQAEFRKVAPNRHNVHVDTMRVANLQRVNDFTSALGISQFWQMPAEPPPSRAVGVDGADWILEGVRDGKYHVVYRWCPEKTPFGKAASELFDLAGHELKGSCGGEL